MRPSSTPAGTAGVPPARALRRSARTLAGGKREARGHRIKTPTSVRALKGRRIGARFILRPAGALDRKSTLYSGGRARCRSLAARLISVRLSEAPGAAW